MKAELQVGDRVRLVDRLECKERARIIGIGAVGTTAYVLDKPLGGFRCWYRDDLRRVKKAKEVGQV